MYEDYIWLFVTKIGGAVLILFSFLLIIKAIQGFGFEAKRFQSYHFRKGLWLEFVKPSLANTKDKTILIIVMLVLLFGGFSLIVF